MNRVEFKGVMKRLIVIWINGLKCLYGIEFPLYFFLGAFTLSEFVVYVLILFS